MEQEKMTVWQLLSFGKEYLRESKISEYELDAYYLLEHVTGMNKTAYFLRQHELVEIEQVLAYKECLKQRENRVPLQYITGSQEFMGLNFQVNANVLIPRQDTEILVEKGLNYLQAIAKNQGSTRKVLQLLDMCTGSGCILISMLYHGKQWLPNYIIKGTGVDISAKALEVAKENARKHELEASFLESDLFAKVKGSFDLILSNPPYIKSSVIPKLMEEVRNFEPIGALDGKEDGLYFYKKIIAVSKNHLNPGGMLAVEIGHDQGQAVARLMEEMGFMDIEVIKDLSGLDRVVTGKEEPLCLTS